MGEHNPAWRGDQVGYRGAHIRVEKARGKATSCPWQGPECTSTFHWASLTCNYVDTDDYASMCVSHHRLFDAAIRSMR